VNFKKPLLNLKLFIVFQKWFIFFMIFSQIKIRTFLLNYLLLFIFEKGALVKFYPETGRKHQIRIHSSFALKAPILGDKKYSVLAEHFQVQKYFYFQY